MASNLRCRCGDSYQCDQNDQPGCDNDLWAVANCCVYWLLAGPPRAPNSHHARAAYRRAARASSLACVCLCKPATAAVLDQVTEKHPQVNGFHVVCSRYYPMSILTCYVVVAAPSAQPPA